MDSKITMIEKMFNKKNPINKSMTLIELNRNKTIPPIVLLHNEQKNDYFSIVCIIIKNNNINEDNLNNHYLQWIVHDVSGSDLHDGYDTYTSPSGTTVVPWETLCEYHHEPQFFMVLSQQKEHDKYVFQTHYNGLFYFNTQQYTLVDVSIRQNVNQEHEETTFAPRWFAFFKSLTSHSFNSM